MKLSIIIVNYKVKYFVEQCLRSVQKALAGIDGEVWVVDNASGDDSLEYLQKTFGQKGQTFSRQGKEQALCPHGLTKTFQSADLPIHFIKNEENVGFGRANNMAIEMAQGEYVLLLNPDTILTEHTLTDCLAFADAHPEMGAMGGRLLSDSGRFAAESLRGLPTPWASLCKVSGLARLFPNSPKFGGYYLSYLPKDKPQEIAIVSGAFLLTRKSVLDQVGTFDERFFMYCEDTDLDCRIVEAGFTNYYYPTPLLHYKGESARQISLQRIRVFYGAIYRYFRKHNADRGLFATAAISVAIWGLAGLAYIKRGVQVLKNKLFRKKVDTNRFLYFGSPSPALDALAKQHGLRIERADEAPSADHFCHVYNTADFTYADILERLEKSDHKHYLGVFHPESGVLITGGDVYSIEN